MDASRMNEIFINRELSWLQFNRRVLELAEDATVPVGEQLKFAAIYASNLDEFFMVRVGSLCDKIQENEKDNKTGMTPAQQLEAILHEVSGLQQRGDHITRSLFERISGIGLRKVDFKKIGREEEEFWHRYFTASVLPLLSPQVIDHRHLFPFLQNQKIYVGMMIRRKESSHPCLGIVPIENQLQRIVFIPENGGVRFALIEEIVEHFAGEIFGKNAVVNRCVFRITRSADITPDENMFGEDADYRQIMSELLEKRRRLAAVRLQVSHNAPREITELLCKKLELSPNQVLEQSAPLDMSVGFKLSSRLAQNGDCSCFYPVRRPMMPPKGYDLIRAAEKQDVLLSYPYQSIRPFLRMLHDAAQDPEVVSVKMTLYRMAHESKIVEALITAAENGKEVVALVELRARFDEQNNIDFSKQLEEAGCTVIYGFEEYKIHSKLTLITRKKAGQISYISQIGTGNYNEKTSEQYTDLSFITSDFNIGTELSRVFSNLAVERLTSHTADLLVAPLCFKSIVLREMDEEIRAGREGKPAEIIIKCNSVSDREIIEKISEASCAGVPVRMIVRGICCVKAGIPGLTENVTIRSIVGRYLEHERVYTFGKGARRRIYIASGDFLTRNTERRVEAGVRIRDPRIADELMQMLELQLRDNVNAREMMPDGSYLKVRHTMDEPLVDSQLAMYDLTENAWGAVQQDEPEKTVPVQESRQEQQDVPLPAEHPSPEPEKPAGNIHRGQTAVPPPVPKRRGYTDKKAQRTPATLLGKIRRFWKHLH